MKLITIITNDAKKFYLNKTQCIKIKLFKNLLEIFYEKIIIINLTSNIFKKIYEFLIMYDKVDLKVDLNNEYNPLELYFSKDDLSYLDKFSIDDIIELINACNYLEYSYLLELSCKKLAILLNNKL